MLTLLLALGIGFVLGVKFSLTKERDSSRDLYWIGLKKILLPAKDKK